APRKALSPRLPRGFSNLLRKPLSVASATRGLPLRSSANAQRARRSAQAPHQFPPYRRMPAKRQHHFSSERASQSFAAVAPLPLSPIASRPRPRPLQFFGSPPRSLPPARSERIRCLPSRGHACRRTTPSNTRLAFPLRRRSAPLAPSHRTYLRKIAGYPNASSPPRTESPSTRLAHSRRSCRSPTSQHRAFA